MAGRRIIYGKYFLKLKLTLILMGIGQGHKDIFQIGFFRAQVCDGQACGFVRGVRAN